MLSGVLLRRLREETSPARLCARLPSVGRELAARIHTALPQIDTLEALEVAAPDGRLRQIEGFGRRRVRQVRAGLRDLLAGHASRRRKRPHRRGTERSSSPGTAPVDTPVETLHTVVTETRGDLAARRVVRGREGACRAFYRRRGELTAA